MRAFVVLVALTLVGTWLGIRHLPRTAEAEVARPTGPQEVQSVALDGRGLPMTALRARLSTRPGELVDAGTLERDRDQLLTELAAQGYLAARVEPARVVYGFSGGAYVTFAIDQGPQFRIRSVTIHGASPAEAGVVTLAIGEVVLGDRIARAREALADRLAARGTPRTVAATLTTDRAAAAVDIDLIATR